MHPLLASDFISMYVCYFSSVLAQVWLGAHNIQQPESSRILVESENLIPHEGYEEATISNDIGLIVLDEPVELNEYIDVVPLPRRETIDDYEGKVHYLVGSRFILQDHSILL